jgi:hypothetical protein
MLYEYNVAFRYPAVGRDGIPQYNLH